MNGAAPGELAGSAPRMGALVAWYGRQVDRFVPARSRGEVDQTRRARLLVGFAFFSVAPGAVFFALALVNYRLPTVTLMAGAATLIAALAPPLLRATGSLAFASNAMLAVNVGTTLVVAASVEGQAACTLPWLALTPLLATMLGGRRAGVLWAIACIALAEGGVALSWWAPFPLHLVSADAARAGAAWNVALFVVSICAFALLYETLRLKTTAALTTARGELDAAREKALVADRLASLGQIAAGVAHEINNPMTFVSSNVALLREDLARGPLDPSLHREYVDDILPATEEGIRRVIHIVGDLRRFARREPEVGVAFDFNAEVRTALRICEKALGDRTLTVRLEPLPPIIGRPSEIAQLTVNLVVNASHATKRGGTVRVETESDGAEIVLRVADDGVGMTSDLKARIFEPFFTTKPVGEGTGLGLAVVHGIVRAHGGTVEVTSEPGRGTTFEVRFPAAPPGR